MHKYHMFKSMYIYICITFSKDGKEKQQSKKYTIIQYKERIREKDRERVKDQFFIMENETKRNRSN